LATNELNWIANFIWGIADDVLRDLYVRGKYRDVNLPMTVLRRLDAVLEPTKQDVLDTKRTLGVSPSVCKRSSAPSSFLCMLGIGAKSTNKSILTIQLILFISCIHEIHPHYLLINQS
jgi:hypothetical protein